MTTARENWTYGVEHEWADWPLDRELPEGFRVDDKDVTIVNSNGIANDPKGRSYRFGGEICTPPTSDRQGQIDALELLKARYPEARVNYRSNLHVHIRIPEILGDLALLKRFQLYVHENMPLLFPIVEPIPRPNYYTDCCARDVLAYSPDEWLRGATRRYNRRKVSHHSLLKDDRLAKQLRARSVEEFFALEVPQSRDGKPLWHLQPRLCVSLRQILQTETIEFRHFPGTLDAAELWACMKWCCLFARAALANAPRGSVTSDITGWEKFPSFPPYFHWMEERYRRTCHDGTLTREQIERNIAEILDDR